VAHFVERFALLMTEAGVPRMASRVFVGLLVADQGRSAGELAAVLQISPAAVSGAVRYLTQVGLIGKAREPGRRSDHYRVESNLWFEVVTQRDAMLIAWEQALREGVQLLGPGSAAGERLEETRQFFEFLSAEFPAMIARWRVLRSRQLAKGKGS
jgi:predicted transcriptional regulator